MLCLEMEVEQTDWAAGRGSYRNRLDGEHGGGPSVNMCLLPSWGRLAHVIYALKN